jgi:hypothetical protein
MSLLCFISNETYPLKMDTFSGESTTLSSYVEISIKVTEVGHGMGAKRISLNFNGLTGYANAPEMSSQSRSERPARRATLYQDVFTCSSILLTIILASSRSNRNLPLCETMFSAFANLPASIYLVVFMGRQGLG